MMESQFNIVLRVLGGGLKDPTYKSFVQWFGAAEQELDVSTSTRFYGFHSKGLSLLYSLTSNYFWSVSFAFNTRSILDGVESPFDGAVYANITGNDTSVEVMQKIGLEPYYRISPITNPLGPDPSSQSTDSIWETYQLTLPGKPPCTLDVSYDTAKGQLKSLSMSFPDWQL